MDCRPQLQAVIAGTVVKPAVRAMIPREAVAKDYAAGPGRPAHPSVALCNQSSPTEIVVQQPRSHFVADNRLHGTHTDVHLAPVMARRPHDRIRATSG